MGYDNSHVQYATWRGAVESADGMSACMHGASWQAEGSTCRALGMEVVDEHSKMRLYMRKRMMNLLLLCVWAVVLWRGMAESVIQGWMA